MPKRDPALDGLRGVAIALVLVYHFIGGRVLPTTTSATIVHALTGLGWCGVDLFFVLSGLLITRNLLAMKGEPGYFSKFYARRILRIFPLYYVVILGLAITVGLGAALPWLLTYTSNLALARPAFARGFPAYLNITWSLAVEEQFYLVWPFLILAVPSRRLRGVCVLLALSAFGFRTVLAWHGLSGAAAIWMPGRMDGLALGALLAAGGAIPRKLSIAAAWTLLALLMVGATEPTIPGIGGALLATIGLSALAIGFAGATGNTLEGRGLFARLAASKSLQWIGRISYGLYLLESPVQVWLDHIGLTSVALNALLGIGGTIAAAWLSWHLIEGPCNRLKRLFPYRPDHRVTVLIPKVSPSQDG